MNQTKAPKGGKIFYGWIIVLCCMLITGAGTGIASNCVGVFVIPVSEALGVSRAEFSLYTTFSAVATMFMAPVVGSFFQKYPFKLLMFVGSAAGASALMLYSIASQLWHFYAIAVMNGLLLGFLNGIPVALLLSRWFMDKKGIATGIAYTGSGIAATIMVPITNGIIESMGWQAGYRTLGIIFLAVTIPTILFLVKARPEDMGLKALGAENAQSQTKAKWGLTKNEAVRTPAYWYFCIAFMMTGFIGMGTQQHIVSYLTDIGYDSAYAASMFSLMMAVLIGGKILLGMIYDKAGVKVGTLYICGVLIISEILLFMAGAGTFMVVAFSVIFGLANAIQTVSMPVLVSHFFGDLEYAAIIGRCTPFYMAGMSMGMPFSAFVYDTVGSYNVAWAGYAVGSVVIMVLLLMADSSSRKAQAKISAEVPQSV